MLALSLIIYSNSSGFGGVALSMWLNINPLELYFSLLSITNDISFLTNIKKFIKDDEESKKSWELELTRETEIDSFEIAWIARDIWENLIEEVRVIDIYENENKFWKGKKSVTIRITFRSLERTLENEEINKMYLKIREKLERELEFELR